MPKDEERFKKLTLFGFSHITCTIIFNPGNIPAVGSVSKSAPFVTGTFVP